MCECIGEKLKYTCLQLHNPTQTQNHKQRGKIWVSNTKVVSLDATLLQLNQGHKFFISLSFSQLAKRTISQKSSMSEPMLISLAHQSAIYYPIINEPILYLVVSPNSIPHSVAPFAAKAFQLPSNNGDHESSFITMHVSSLFFTIQSYIEI